MSSISPFDDFSLPSGGIILRSSDGVDFKVYKNILALASPIFRDMFTLPQAPIPGGEVGDSGDVKAGDKTVESSNVVTVTESSGTLQVFLRLIYPIQPPVLEGISSDGTITDAKALFDGIQPVLAAAMKYETTLAQEFLVKKLIDGAETTLPDGSVLDDTLALRTFVLACQLGRKPAARDAAHAALKGQIAGFFISELRSITAAQYFYVIQHHTSASKVALSFIKSSTRDLPSPYKELMYCSTCGKSEDSYTAKWWTAFATDAIQILSTSPRSRKLFLPKYMQGLSTKRCSRRSYSEGCAKAAENWGTVVQYIRDLGDSIESSISKIKVCVDEI